MTDALISKEILGLLEDIKRSNAAPPTLSLTETYEHERYAALETQQGIVAARRRWEEHVLARLELNARAAGVPLASARTEPADEGTRGARVSFLKSVKYSMLDNSEGSARRPFSNLSDALI
jgi:hypothetical protein